MTPIKKPSKAVGYTLKIVTIIFFILGVITMFVNIWLVFLFTIPGLICAIGYRSAAKRYNKKLLEYARAGGKI